MGDGREWLTFPPKTGDAKTGVCDGCDDCDDIFDTAPTPILIVTIVTNRHPGWERRHILLPALVRLDVYSTWYSLASSPAFTFNCRVRILG